VKPAAQTIKPQQPLNVTVTVNGSTATVAGSVTLTSGEYHSRAATLTQGSVTIGIPAGSLPPGSDTLTATYTPDTGSSSMYTSASGSKVVVVTPTNPVVTVTPGVASLTSVQGLLVWMTVSGSYETPTGTVTLNSGNYTSAPTALEGGSTGILIPAGSLPAGTDTLTATYTPENASSSTYTSATGTNSVFVTKSAPSITAIPSASSILTTEPLSVAVTVSGGMGAPLATGTVMVTSGTYSSSAVTLSNGTASIVLPGGTLAMGNETLTVAYAPDSPSSGTYNSASGTTSVSVIQLSTVTVDQSSTGPAVTDQLLGTNMAAWFDPAESFVAPALQAAGIKALRWPGGGLADLYHWQGNFSCVGTPPDLTPSGEGAFPGDHTSFITSIQIPLGADVALTANYGTNAACTGPGDPKEAADWVKAWEKAGGFVSHVTVGDEVYGAWEPDLHAKPNDPGTYATSTAIGYYPDIKAVDKNVMVGVVVDADNMAWGWDSIVLSKAKYDFVEYHYYAQGPGQENDTYLTKQAAQDLTTAINTIKGELKEAGNPNVPIYVGEIGSVWANPGKQSSSITQGLFAGQVLGEMMNAGVSRLTWWMGFGGCNGSAGNDNAALYGWQNFGTYNLFSAGDSDPTCPDAGPAGTMSPTAQAFNLFQQVAVTGESVLTASVAGDTTDVRAYAATHTGGTAVVLFNLNENTKEPVQINLSQQKLSAGVTVVTYSKSIYDDSQNGKWDSPTTSSMGAQSLPMTLMLDPWSINVVVIQ
jgi:alpha-L-arabinofuranosidase